MPAFRDMTPGEKLNHFHDRCVESKRTETRSRKREINAFVRFLQAHLKKRPYTVASVRKGGSLGKGTAVRDFSDIDLVVIINGLSSISDLIHQRSFLLDSLDTKVQCYEPWRGKVRLAARTSYSLCYILNGQKVDVLPALDFKRVYGNAQGVYNEMKKYTRKEAAQEFSASLCPLQVGFVKPQGGAEKRVIRLLKFWKEEKGLAIRSYTLELLTIHVAQGGFKRAVDLFHRVLSQLTDCKSIKVAFDVNYTSAYYTRHLSPPYVLDPANPYMDTLHGVDVDSISREATQMLQRL